MGLFDKKFCDVCGEKIGMLGNRKLEDGNICKDCAKKLSPWFDDRRHSTLEEIKSQLQMREENRSLVSSFHPGRVIRSDRYNLYIDERQQLFAASVNLDREDNPDIISLSQITGCNLDVNEMRTEEYRTDRDGERESYNPPRYSYSYDYYFYIYLNHPYIHEMKLKLNSMDLSEDDRNRRHDVERAGQEMMSYLQNVTGCTVGGMGMNQGMGMPQKVPAPRISRMVAIAHSASVKPRPMPRPSIAESTTPCLFAYISALPRMMQLTTISARYTPSD